MKRTLIAALASLMLAGVLAGASEPVFHIAPAAIFTLDEGSSPVLISAPFATSYGDSLSH